jgi:uncharacterized damage-inducible protein DinB
MTLRHTLLHRLKDTWHGAPWYGTPSDKVMEGITAAEAARQLAPGTHTIWQLVLHMTAWTETTAQRARGMGSKAPDRGDWPAVGETTEAAWQSALADLQAARASLLEEVGLAHEEDLQLHVKQHDPPFKDTGMSRAGTVYGLIEHDIYHLGQIALLKKALRATP